MKAIWFALFVCAFNSAAEPLRVEGEVIPTAGTVAGMFWAQLDGVSGSSISRVPVTPDGRFVFNAVPSGVYTLRIVDELGQEFASQTVTVRDDHQELRLTLREPNRERRAAGGKISVAELRHQPAKKAKRAAREAEKFTAAGDHVRAVAALERAVALDPEYIQARGNLGAEYLALRRYPEAVAELRRAEALDPAAGWLQSNLAFALWQSGDPVPAEQAARRAVSLDAANARSRYLLGWILLRRPGAIAEGVEQLERAAHDYAPAHRTLADFYRATGQTALARQEMERYRQAEPRANQKEIEAFMATLR